MQRRDFLKSTSLLSLALTTPLRSAWGAEDTTPNRFYLLVNASGGWDPTSFCDPKGNIPRDDGRGPVNRYNTEDISALVDSPIRYAPFPNPDLLAAANAAALRDDMVLTSFDDFFTRHAAKMLVINGIDVQTVSHSVGSRTIWSGSDQLDSPSFGAVAASLAAHKPMAYISNGGYDHTSGLVGATRVNGAETLQELAFPNLPNAADDSRVFFKPAILAMIDQAHQQRLQYLLETTKLPQRRMALNRMLNVSDEGLNNIVLQLETIQNNLPEGQLSSGLKGQAELAAAAFAAGTAVSANLSIGGFDTHGSHDRNQLFNLTTLVDGLNHLWDMLTLVGVAEQTTVIVGSDFGRTPFYNDGAGKDHWNITSMLFMGADMPGNKIIGATDANVAALKIDPTTLAIASDQNDPAAISLTPAHIHVALRHLIKVNSNDFSNRFPLTAPFLDLFATG